MTPRGLRWDAPVTSGLLDGLVNQVASLTFVSLNKVSPVALGQFAGEAVEVKAVYRIDHHPAKDHSSLEKHTGDIRVRNLIKLLRLPA